MFIDTIIVGMLQVNCYILGSKASGVAVIVDPGDEHDRIQTSIDSSGLRVRQIICTHGHFDHIGAAGELKESTGADILVHRDDSIVYKRSYEVARSWGIEAHEQPEPDIFIEDGYLIDLGDVKIKVVHTPGHSPGGICLLGDGFVITGDTLFAGSVGRTDFPGGDFHKLAESFRRLMQLEDKTIVMPGHGPSSSIGHERLHNPFSSEFLY